MFAGKRWSAYTALGITIALTGLFAYRYSLTGKAIPAILAVISGGMLLFLLAQSTSWKE
jgi:uncharacterized membrane protein (UPF0136 family)